MPAAPIYDIYSIVICYRYTAIKNSRNRQKQKHGHDWPQGATSLRRYKISRVARRRCSWWHRQLIPCGLSPAKTAVHRCYRNTPLFTSTTISIHFNTYARRQATARLLARREIAGCGLPVPGDVDYARYDVGLSPLAATATSHVWIAVT